MARLLAPVVALATVCAALGQAAASLRGAAPAAAAPEPAAPAEGNASSGASGGGAPEGEADITFLNTTNITEDDITEEDDSVDPDTNSTEAAQQVLLRAGGGDCASPGSCNSRGCALYRMCRGRTVCVINGYLVVPGTPLSGMEEINGGTAGRWDFLWSVARGQCGSDGCVLITNPVGHRTQEQMHIHFRHYNGGGAALKKRLEGALCGTSGWRPFGMCGGGGKARLFDGMPGVFSAVAGAYGGGSLANVGITVWFTSACGGGQKVMLLATTHCSIEHSISAR